MSWRGEPIASFSGDLWKSYTVFYFGMKSAGCTKGGVWSDLANEELQVSGITRECLGLEGSKFFSQRRLLANLSFLCMLVFPLERIGMRDTLERYRRDSPA